MGEKPKLLGDITNPHLIYLKGFLFLLTGVIASIGLLLEYPQWRVAALLCIAVWSFARFYYFAFYVIEHYVDGQYKFAGLTSFVVYLWRREGSTAAPGDEVKERRKSYEQLLQTPASARHRQRVFWWSPRAPTIQHRAKPSMRALKARRST